MSTLENSTNPKVLANHVKHVAFTRCAELNCYGMVDAQIAAIESELLVNWDAPNQTVPSALVLGTVMLATTHNLIAPEHGSSK